MKNNIMAQPIKSDTIKKDSTRPTVERRRDTNKAAMIEALRQSHGNVTIACNAVHINRSTHYEWMGKDPEYRAAVEAIAEEAIDFAENSLFNAIAGGDTTATIFFLKTRGKGRGYTEKTDIKVSGTLNHVGEMTDEAIQEELARIRAARERKL